MIALQVVKTSFGFHLRACMGCCFPPPGKKSTGCFRWIFLPFLLDVVDLPSNYKNAVFSIAKVAYKHFKMAIIMCKLCQSRQFSLLLWRLYGAFILEWPATVAHCYALMSAHSARCNISNLRGTEVHLMTGS